MYLYKTFNSQSEVANDPLLPILLDTSLIQESHKIEIWCTDIKDEGSDFEEFRFFKADQTKPFLVKRFPSY